MTKLAQQLQRKVAALEQQQAAIAEQLDIYRAALDREMYGESPVPRGRPERSNLQPTARAGTEFVRDLIFRNAKRGIDIEGVKKAAQRGGLQIPPNFPYTILFKLRRGLEVVQDSRGRYYPAPMQSENDGEP